MARSLSTPLPLCLSVSLSLSSHQYSESVKIVRFFFFLSSNHFIAWTKVLASQKWMVYLGLFHPCEQRANISDIDQDKELALVLLWQTPTFSLSSAYQPSRSVHSYLRPATALRELTIIISRKKKDPFQKNIDDHWQWNNLGKAMRKKNKLKAWVLPNGEKGIDTDIVLVLQI